MQPQGTALVNTQYFDALIDDVNAINLCSQLQAVVDSVFASLQAQVTAIEAKIAALTIIATIPHDLPSVITWIENFVSPQAVALANYIAQVTALLAKITELTTAIENAAARIGSCSITIPTIGV